MGKRPNLLLDRYRSQARITASARSEDDNTASGDSILPSFNDLTGSISRVFQSGGHTVNETGLPVGGQNASTDRNGGPVRTDSSVSDEKSSGHDTDATSPAAAPPAHKSEDALAGNPPLGVTAADAAESPKPTVLQRMSGGTKRFGMHLRNAIFHSWINVLLIAVPVGIIAKAINLNAAAVFAINAVAIIPLAGLLAYATESVAVRLGDTLGALLNVSFGNAVELIIFIIALVKNEIAIVQASILGSILANLLLILGMAFLLGGLRYREQVYNSTVTQMSACLLSLSVMSLLLPTAFHASFNEGSSAQANSNVLKVSRGTSIVLLIVYILYLLFQLKSHAYMYESTPQEIIDEESHPGVLADIMNSSSSSDDSDSDSSDSSASGSIIATSRRVKRMFKSRRRRMSNATASSAVTSPSLLSAVSTAERTEYPWIHQVRHAPGTRRLSTTTDGNEAELEHDTTLPRIRDFVNQLPDPEDAKPPESVKAPESIKKRSRFRHHKRSHKHKRRHQLEDGINEEPAEPAQDAKTAEVVPSPKVGFSDEIQVVPSATTESQQHRFNMRQLSSRNVFHRPALAKVLSNNVFVQPAPTNVPVGRPLPIRAHTVGTGMQRSNSLPEIFNHTQTPAQPLRLDPLPPFRHQRPQVRIANPDGSGNIVAPTDEVEPKEQMSRTAAVILLLCTTVLVAICAEFMVDAIPAMISSSSVSQAFIGLIILPIVGNAAEHVTAVTVAAKNKMDLAIGISLGSSIQIAIFITPVVVLLGWIMDKDMTLYFNIFDTVCLFVTAFVVNFLILDGRSNYLEGSLLIAAYVIIALGAFFYPSENAQSGIGSGSA